MGGLRWTVTLARLKGVRIRGVTRFTDLYTEVDRLFLSCTGNVSRVLEPGHSPFAILSLLGSHYGSLFRRSRPGRDDRRNSDGQLYRFGILVNVA